MRESYNIYLYKKRKESKFSLFKFAKKIGVNFFLYYLVERGYIKPTKGMVNKFSIYFDEDYSIYLEGESSYPEEYVIESQSTLYRRFLKFLGKKSVRISFLSLSIACVASIISGVVITKTYSNNPRNFYDDTIYNLNKDIKEKGGITITLLDDFLRPEISEYKKDDHFYSIKGNYSEIKFYQMSFTASSWKETNFRVTLALNTFGSNENTLLFRGTVINYEYNYIANAAISLENGDAKVLYLKYQNDEHAKKEEPKMKEFLAQEAFVFSERMETLIEKNTGNKIVFKDFLKKINDGHKFQLSVDGVMSALIYGGLLVGLIFSFAFLFSLMFGNKEGKVIALSHSDELFGYTKKNEMKKDIKFSPFIPETLLELFGIVLVLIGSMRIVYYFFVIFGGIPLSSSDLQSIPNVLMTVFMTGMFLLYFVDFDIFLDDWRVLRNIPLYFFTFIFLYVIEASLMSTLQGSNNIIAAYLSNFYIPNVFGTVACYFLIMMFLFFTPKFIKTKRALIIFRLCSLIPVIWIIICYIMRHADVLFGANLNIWVSYFFAGERVTFSMLAILYLFGYFGLRQFFKWRLGEQEANRYFNGNKFLFMKNILACLIILAVWLVDLYFNHTSIGKSLDLGLSTQIIILIPFILFYHPHKGPRNRIVDWTTLILYFIALSGGYLLILGGIVLL